MEKKTKAPKIHKLPESEKLSKEEMKRTEFDPRPNFSISNKLFPEAGDWSTGKKYKVEVEVEMIGSRIQDWGDQKGETISEFKITSIGAKS